MVQECTFIFCPLVPTEMAFREKTFSDYVSISLFFTDLRIRESTSKNSYSGFIYFKGPYENYNDGTMGFYNNPKWWESGAKSCVNGCCRVPLEKGYVLGTVRVTTNQRKYFPRNWLEFKSIEGLEQLFSKITDKNGISQIRLTDYGHFTVHVQGAI